jgi:hypothetical protein
VAVLVPQYATVLKVADDQLMIEFGAHFRRLEVEDRVEIAKIHTTCIGFGTLRAELLHMHSTA